MSRSDHILADRQDEIDIIALWHVVWGSRYLIFFTTCACVLLAVIYALTATWIFRAEVVIAAAHDEGLSGKTSSLTSQLGGLASLAGLDLANTSSDHDALAVLNSRRLIEEFIKRQNLIPVLLKNNKEHATLWFAVKQFKEHIVTIRDDKRANLTIVDIDWTDPETAARWANGFIALANELIRTRASEDSSRNIAYLTRQTAQTNVVDMQRVLYDLIESEMKTLMLASGRIEYAFTVIDPAVPPEVRKSPQRVLIVIIAVALGLLLGVLAAFVRERLRRSRAARPIETGS